MNRLHGLAPRDCTLGHCPVTLRTEIWKGVGPARRGQGLESLSGPASASPSVKGSLVNKRRDKARQTSQGLEQKEKRQVE